MPRSISKGAFVDAHLLEKVEHMNQLPLTSPKMWKEKAEEITAIFTEWKTIGPVPESVNDQIWKRFRDAQGVFNLNKKQFFDSLNSGKEKNLALKISLCEEAEKAVHTLLRWAGDDPAREGLRDTPARVAKAFEDWFSGYDQDPEAYLARTFEEIEGYDDMVILKDIRFESHCEHHLAPIIGRAHVGYLPTNRVVGISKLARVVEAYARRLQVQEKMNSQIAHTIEKVLKPKGVAVVMSGLDLERAVISPICVGMAERALELAGPELVDGLDPALAELAGTRTEPPPPE